MIPDIGQILDGFKSGQYTWAECVGWMQRHIDLAGHEIDKQLERRELFKQVALKLDLQDLTLKTEQYDAIIDDRNRGIGYKKQVQKWRNIPVFAEGKAEFIGALTEAIISAADEFAKKGEG